MSSMIFKKDLAIQLSKLDKSASTPDAQLIPQNLHLVDVMNNLRNESNDSDNKIFDTSNNRDKLVEEIQYSGKKLDLDV